jgi:hypothetical protein
MTACRKEGNPHPMQLLMTVFPIGRDCEAP